MDRSLRDDAARTRPSRDRSSAVENVSAPASATSTGSSGRGAHAPFVGRAREFAELDGALEALRDGRGGLYLLSGEPGIGKTRLAERVADAAAERGTLVLWGRCWESGGAPAYWPWVQVLRAAFRGRDEIGRASGREGVGLQGVG